MNGMNCYTTNIAIIVPVYNCDKYLAKCITSILKQSFKEYKLILVNDGSTDNSSNICENFAAKDNRITVIHQKNRGSVEARKTGVFSTFAQSAKYIVMMDSDDIMPKGALRLLFEAAEFNQADCVCGKMRRLWRNVVIPQSNEAPCFILDEEKTYDHLQIMENLFVSCFGISNFPVNLWGKLYRTELITEACNCDPIVQFMGDDLSITLRVMPRIQKLVIIPKMVYFYRIGGQTTHYMPYMLDDFVSLYNFKLKMVEKYSMPQDVVRYMNIELINCTRSYFFMCMESGRFDEILLEKEVVKTIGRDEISLVARALCESEYAYPPLAYWIVQNDYFAIVNDILTSLRKNRYRRLLRKILIKLQ